MGFGMRLMEESYFSEEIASQETAGKDLEQGNVPENDSNFNANKNKNLFTPKTKPKNIKHVSLSLVQKKTLRMIDELAELTHSSVGKVNKTRKKAIDDQAYAKGFYEKYKEYYLELKANSVNKNVSDLCLEEEMEDTIKKSQDFYVFIHKMSEKSEVKKLSVDKFPQMKYFHGVLVENVSASETPFK